MLPSPHLPPPLVGRDRELDILRERLTGALAGQGGVVLIGGEAGIGKTALAEAICREAAERGALVLVGRCYDLTETPPYGPFLELFRGYDPANGLPPLPAAFSRRGAAGGAPSQAALFRQVQEFLAAVAAVRPTVLLFDDLHWADPASLDLVRVLARSIRGLPLLMLIAYRADELSRRHPLHTLLPLLEREAAATRLALRPLAADAVRALITARYTPAEPEAARMVAYLDARAGGNALFVTQLLRALEEEGILVVGGRGWELGDLGRLGVPLPLMQVIDARLTRLTDETQALLAVAAVLGQEVPLGLWAAVAAATDEAILAAAEQALAARLVDAPPDGMAVRFDHALIREALYEGMPPPRRRIWHRKVGEILATVPAADPDAVAYHFQRSGDERALPWLRAAGERARASFAYTTAVERMREAVALLDRPEDGAQAASLCLQISWMLRFPHTPQSLRYAEEAVRRAEEADDPVLLGVARCRLGRSFWMGGDYARGIAELRAAVPALEALPPEAWERTAAPRWHTAALEGDRSSATDVRSSLAFPLAVLGACGEALALLGGTLDLDDAALAAANADKLDALHVLAEHLGQPDVARRVHAELARVMRAEEHWYELGIHSMDYLVRMVLTYRADDRAYREEVARAAEEVWVRVQALHLIDPFPMRAVRFALDFITGAWDAAPTYAPVVQTLGGPHPHIVAITLGSIARAQGRAEDARRLVREWLPGETATEPGSHPLVYALLFLHLGGLLALDAGDLDGAKEWAEASDRLLAWSGAVIGQSEGQALWAQYHRQAGDMDKAREHAERALAHAGEPRQPLALIAAHRLVGELDTLSGRHADAACHLDLSLRLADACAAPYERALTLLATAALRAATGDTDAAALLLAEVRAICEPLEAKPALARAAALAERLEGAHAAPPAYPAGLSVREVEVLRLVAAGLTNPQVAAHLSLSPRTVGQHLRSIYNKLGVPSRAAAARWAAERGLTRHPDRAT